MQLTQRESKLLKKDVRELIRETGEVPRTQPAMMNNDLELDTFMSKAGKNKWDRTIYHFEGLGYWVAPVGVTLYQFKPGQYTISRHLNGTSVRRNVCDPEDDLELFVEMLGEAVDAVTEQNGGYYTLFSMKGIYPTTLTKVKQFSWVMNTPKIFREFDPSLPKASQRYFKSNPELEEVRAEELRKVRQEMMDRFMPRMVTTRESIMTFHDEFPWDYMGEPGVYP